jgi:hypothetical protein
MNSVVDLVSVKTRMKVKELVKELQGMDQDALVVLQKDSEGNGYSPLSGADDSEHYVAESSWDGYVGPKELTKELEEEGYTEEDIASDGVPCVVLYPVN